MTSMFTQRAPEDKIRWHIDCGDIDDDVEGYARTEEEARKDADTWASFCPFACVYIEDAKTGEVLDFYWF